MTRKQYNALTRDEKIDVLIKTYEAGLFGAAERVAVRAAGILSRGEIAKPSKAVSR